jgi:hypothetical protein
MKQKTFRTIALGSLVLVVVLGTAWHTHAQESKTLYPSMAPLDQYLTDRNAEIAMARSAAPDSISQDAQVMVLGRNGYETAVKGKNGFVCVVERSWATETDDPQFWNPKMRAPICFNASAARSVLPITIKKTEWILAGRSRAQVAEGLRAAFEKKELTTPESGAMCYMMSKQGYLNDQVGHWHPHLMFFSSLTDPKTWGADLPGSPLLTIKNTEERLTVFLLTVEKWSDGTPAHEEMGSGVTK